ncbi:hypothetical protein ATO6_11340 [Oceanicola sp. 22II-s10i]|uniref:YicC/YloC family endoribonuclease n=1 Tax=Oceanicola sp. 22II-s10i TaxID=1317116 RepID=UPI000B525744|nr:YicC/YloC family endoribonuclease [Oceanicola sp. 22II-s10i]OWU84899.1 hypothetical protein ATO6_11340 [Oceanicola sp. 22II-s10i]
MIKSMTGFATGRGTFGAFEWTWDLRSVNGRGLDLRLRVPDWVSGLEQALRKRLGEALSRGNVSLSLRLGREGGTGGVALDMAQLDAVLDALAEVEARALERGMTLAPSRAGDVLMQRGVLDTPRDDDETGPLLAAIMKDFEPVLAAFIETRAREGAAMKTVLAGQVDRIEALTADAAGLIDARKEAAAEAFRAALARIMDTGADADPARVAQEIALLAVKNDVTEEIDRLRAHVSAARDLLGSKAPVGRKLDFLTQEFNREANTLCSKSQNAELTGVGLELKAVIDQLREQVQNVE